MDNVIPTAPSSEPDGNQEFTAIITEHQTALLRYVARLVNDAAAAQDVVQETFLKLFRVWRAGARPTENLKPWLYRVAHNAALDYIRHETRLRRWHEEEAAERAAASADPSDPPDQAELVLGQLRCLAEPEQQVLLLRLQEGLSYREIGLVTGRTEGNVGCLLHHAVKKLSVSLKKAGLIAKGEN
jgi:RNA polymerase sigma-70 factor (ECF subfamily)